MNTRGLMEIVVLNVGLESGILDRATFTILVIMTLFATFLTTPLVDSLYSPQKQDFELSEFEEEQPPITYVPPTLREGNSSVVFLLNNLPSLESYIPIFTLLSVPASLPHIFVLEDPEPSSSKISPLPVANALPISTCRENIQTIEFSDQFTTNGWVWHRILTAFGVTIQSIGIIELTPLLTASHLVILPVNDQIEWENSSTLLSLDLTSHIGLLGRRCMSFSHYYPQTTHQNGQTILILLMGTWADLFILKLCRLYFLPKRVEIRLVVFLQKFSLSQHENNFIRQEIDILKQTIRDGKVTNLMIHDITETASHLTLETIHATISTEILKCTAQKSVNLAISGYFPSCSPPTNSFSNPILTPSAPPLSELVDRWGVTGSILSATCGEGHSLIIHSNPSTIVTAPPCFCSS